MDGSIAGQPARFVTILEPVKSRNLSRVVTLKLERTLKLTYMNAVATLCTLTVNLHFDGGAHLLTRYVRILKQIMQSLIFVCVERDIPK